MKARYFLALVLLAPWGAGRAAEWVIHAGHMIDVVNGKVTDKVTITVSDNRITSVEQGFQVPQDGQQLVDLGSETVMPGLMDMHVHLTTEVSPQLFTEKFIMESADYAYRAKVFAERTLLAGFTTVREMGDQDRNLGASMKRAIARHWIHGPRIYTAGKGLATTGGLADYSNGLRHEYMGNPGPVEGVIDGPIEARKAVRQRYKDGADFIKINLTGGAINPTEVGFGAQWRQDELDEAVATARDYNMTVAAHAVGAEGIRRAILAGVTSVEHGTYMDESLAKMMKEQGIVYVPTITAIKWIAKMRGREEGAQGASAEETVDVDKQIDRAFKIAYKTGVKIAFGTDAGVFPNGTNAQEFVYMVNDGMKPLEAIQSATLEAARLLRIERQLGSIEPGKLADLVSVRGNPLEDISLMKSMSFVMKDGIVYKQDNRVVVPIGDMP